MKDLRELLSISNVADAAKPWFDRDNRIWVVPVIQSNLRQIRNIIQTHRFEMDVTVRDYLALVQCSSEKSSICAYDNDGDRIIVNVCDNEIFAAWIKNVAGGEWI